MLSKVRRATRALLTDSPEFAEHADRILDKLDNRVTLDERLRGLLEYVGEPAMRLLGGADGCERWLVAAKRSRNDLGHTGHTKRFEPTGLNAIARAAEVLLELVIAKHLGADADHLAGVVDRRERRVKRLLDLLPLAPASTADTCEPVAPTAANEVVDANGAAPEAVHAE
jgi:hypothetical protein